MAPWRGPGLQDPGSSPLCGPAFQARTIVA